MLANRRFSIKTKLIIIYLLIAIPLVALLAFSFYERFQANQAAVLEERLEIARLAASNFNLFISQTVLAETIIGNTIIAQELSPEEASAFLARTVTRHPASDIEFLSPDGVIIAASLEEKIGQDESARPSIRAIIGGEESAVSNLRPDNGASPLFTIATGIRENDVLVGIVSMSIRADDLDDVLDVAVRVGGVNIVDSNGRLVFQSQVRDIPFEERDWSDEPFIREALEGRTFTSTGLVFPLDGSFRMGAEIPIRNIGWATGSFAPVETVLAPITRDAILSAVLALAVISLALLLALILGNRLVGGIITLRNRMIAVPKAGPIEHVKLVTGDEIEDLANNFNRMQDELLAAQIRQNNLQNEIQERNRELSILYETQKNVASVLQESLLPKVARIIDHLEIGLHFQSATEAAFVGGDFYDFIEISENKFGIVIGDVSGKGLEAATLTATIRNTLRAFAYDETSPARVVERVNRIAIIETPPSVFVTLFYGIFDACAHEFTYTNAGHWPPMIFTPADNSFTELEAGGLPLGVFPNATFINRSAKLAAASIVVLYTDGVIESRVKGELFGVARLQQAIKTHAELSPDEIAKNIITEARNFGGGKLQDDAAVMVIRVTE